MKPPGFRYFAPQNIEEALVCLAKYSGEACILAGGQSLVPRMNRRIVHPAVLVDINGIDELAYVHPQNSDLTLGATTRDATLVHDVTVTTRLPLLAEAARCVGHPAIRNRGTLGGSMAHADPAAELPTVMLVLNAEFAIRNHAGYRTIHARNFFKGPLSTDLKTGEMLTELRIPDLPAKSGSAFLEFSRRAGDYALAGVAAVLALNSNVIVEARLGLCGVAPTPVRPQSAEALLQGQSPGEEVWTAAANAAVAALDHPPSDIHGSADYRRHLAGILVKQALAIAAKRAGRSQNEQR